MALLLNNSDEMDQNDLIEHIYSEYYDYIRYKASQKLADQSYIEDVVQDAMLKIIRNINKIKFNDEDHLKAICGLIAEQVAIDFNRKNSQNLHVLSYDDLIGVFEQTTNSPDYCLVTKTDYNIILDTVESFKGTLKDVCYLSLIEGLDNTTISIMLNLDPNVVAAYISRGKRRIAEKLREME